MSAAIYQLEHVSKIFKGPVEELRVLDDITLDISAGESIAVVGASGCGKTTLLHILGTLDTPTTGRVLFEEASLLSLNNAEKAHFRNRKLGFVFQFHHLLSEFSTLENVAMQAIIGGMPRKRAYALAADALRLVGLSAREKHSVTTLSGGERQRAAIARALLLQPRVLLADEPTGNLDEKTGAQVAELLRRLNAEMGMTMIIVTHNLELAASLGKCLELKGGRLSRMQM